MLCAFGEDVLFGLRMRYSKQEKEIIGKTIDDMVNSLSDAELLALVSGFDRDTLMMMIKEALIVQLGNKK